jgi:hypothetical protein
MAGDDAGQGPSQNFGPLEDVLEIFGVVVQRQAPGRSGSTQNPRTSMPSATVNLLRYGDRVRSGENFRTMTM